MDLSKETDLNKLKALAYDIIAQNEAGARDLQSVNQRIAAVMETQAPKEKQQHPSSK
jgi:hypothetical protein